MRVVILAIGLLCAAVPAAPAAAASPTPAAAAAARSPVLRFATYNVCKTTCGTGKFAWSRRSQAVLRNILSAKPDVLALQEVDKSYAWMDEQLGRHGYARVTPRTTSCGGCVADSQLYYRTAVVAAVTKRVPTDPIPGRCMPYFPNTPGVLFEPPDEPPLSEPPEFPDIAYDDPEYEQKVAAYKAAYAAWEAEHDRLWALYDQQYAAYRQFVAQYKATDCDKYVGWQPYTENGSGEVALSTWGSQALATSAEDRNLVWAVLMVKASRSPFVATSIHLPNEKTGPAEKYRKSLAKAIPARLREVQKQLAVDGPIVLLGDLNSYAYRQPRGAQWILGKAGFRDAYKARKRVNADAQTVNVTTLRRNPFPPRPFRNSNPARLDYVMVDRGLPLRYEVHLRLRGGRFDDRYRGSDHNLVLADLRLSAGRLDGAWSAAG